MRTGVRRVGLLSAVAAPVLLIGGWTVAAARQPEYDAVSGTISALAALDATDRWLMTAALTGLGLCYVVTAWSLRPAHRLGRWLLVVGGVATVLVAAFPLPSGDGRSTAHTVAAGAALVAPALWPAAAWRRGAHGWPLRRGPALVAAAVLLGLVGWFAVERGGDRVGLAERVAAGAQALWPLVVVAAVARASGVRPARGLRAER